MAELSNIRFVHAIQYLRSHLQELVEAENVQQVDQELTKLLKQPSGEERADQLRELILEHNKAYDWWLNFNQTLQSDAIGRAFTGSGAADGILYGDSSPEPLLITCAKCSFFNSLLSWNDQIFCQNPDLEWSKHYIEP